MSLDFLKDATNVIVIVRVNPLKPRGLTARGRLE
jgi:hypothetical protein